MKTPAKPQLNRVKTPFLVGKCFVIFDKNNKVQCQGIVRDIENGVVLIQFFDALMGMPSTLKLVSLIEMMGSPLDREAGQWEFFEDDKHLQEWAEGWGKRCFEFGSDT